MGTATLTIDRDAIAANWRALDQLSGTGVETAGVVKADGYGLGAVEVAHILANQGVRSFFVAVAEEGAALRKALGHGPKISVFSGHMAGDAALLRDHELIPLLNSGDQAARHRDSLPGHPFGVQLDTGMNRLGMEAEEWDYLRGWLLGEAPSLVISHLACADDVGHPQNAAQLRTFQEMTDGIGAPRSLAATGGAVMGAAYHFDHVRPGIGLYGGAPHGSAHPVVTLSLPVIQSRELSPGEAVGYGATWVASRPSRIATVSAGYADGLLRAKSNRAQLWAGDTPCPLVGRVSMDLITVDITDLGETPETLDILGPHQGVDDLAEAGGTIGYEILTGLGARYERRYVGGHA
ncbi:MAG: alanine racemase [Pseudomonadota bacterium]